MYRVNYKNRAAKMVNFRNNIRLKIVKLSPNRHKMKIKYRIKKYYNLLYTPIYYIHM